MILWGITDGRAGHLTQLQGLCSALARQRDCEYHELPVPPLSETLPDLALGRARFTSALPDPDILIGAGHASHLPMLCARRARGGKTVVLMRPSLPRRCFDICILPEHDGVPETDNVILSRGPINNVLPAQERKDFGVILAGGPSRHYRWDDDTMLQQIATVIDRDPRRWLIADSPRTPSSMSKALAELAGRTVDFLSWPRTPANWLRDRLGECDTVWVSEDSMSMVYEALTGGAGTGLLEVPPRRNSRIVRAMKSLAESGDVTRFGDWHGDPLPLPRRTYNEAERCAGKLLHQLGLLTS
ncbi:MAG: mitochondrial fission ELM1 family protein [Gammaproteobacteria bacterium]